MLDNVDRYTTTSSGTVRRVDSLHLIHGLPANGDGSNAKLWMSDVQRSGDPDGTGSGAVGPTVAPTVHFVGGTALNNRADYNTGAGVLPMDMFRVSDIVTSLGGEIQVSYTRPNKCNGSNPDPLPSGFIAPGGWDHNAYDCFPYYTVPRGGSPGFAINNKYLATEVDLIDLTGASPTQTYTYSFLGSPAWHFEDDPMVQSQYQSWSDWRGHSAVRSQTGSGTVAVTTTKTIYFQGMDGDQNANGTTKSVTISDDHGGNYTDSNYLRGRVIETQNTKNNPGTWTEITSTVDQYTQYGPLTGNVTATMTFPSNGMVDTSFSSRMMRETETDNYRASSGGTIESESRTAYDSTYGLPTANFSDGDVSTTADNSCFTSSYARNVNTATPIFIVDHVSQAIARTNATTVQNCGDGTAIAKTNTLYDNNTGVGVMGTHGNPTEVEKFVNSGTGPTVDTTYDTYGRVTQTAGPDNESNGNVAPTTSTSYTPSDYNVTTSTTVTNAYGETTATTLDPERGLPTSVVDMRNQTTTSAYDGLGRLTTACLPTDTCTTHPTDAFVYTVDNSPASGANPAEVETDQLQSGSTVKKSFSFLDGWGRPMETQYDSPLNGGGVDYYMSTTCYDVRGLVAKTQNPFTTAGVAGANVNDTCAGHPASEHLYAYDELGRQLTDQAYTGGISFGGTATTAYDGYTITKTSPEGRMTRTITDVFGRTTNDRQLTSSGVTYSDTETVYDLNGCVTTTFDEARHETDYGCDWLARHTSRTDKTTPLNRTWTFELNDHGDIHSVTDPNGASLTTHYDNLWRPVEVFDNTAESGTVLNGWTRDTTNHNSTSGLLTASVRNEPTLSGTGTDTYTISYGYDARARVTSKTFTLPTELGGTGNAYGFASSYAYSYTYDSADHVTSTTDPAAGSLAAETITTGAYNTFGDPGNVTSSSGATYISSRAYDSINRPTNLTFGSATGSNDLTRSFSYDTPSQLLAGEVTDIQTTPSVTHVQNDAYQYDHDFNIIKITDALNANQNQCFNIDDYQRLSQAWTTLDSTCSDYGTPNNGSTANPYKIQYNYDSVGRTDSIVTTLPTASTDTFSRDVQAPFAITATSSPSNTYGYDADGQQTTRDISGQPNATLTWTDDHLLRSYAPTAGGTPNTTYRYDADGNRILRQENGTSSSTTTLYLDNTELSSTGGTVTATRYLTDGSTTIGYISSGGVYWLAGNNQNSASYSTLAHSTTFQSQQYLPTGGLRGTSTLTGTEHDFLNKTQDPQTGLDQLGARYYDTLTTNFISTDPMPSTGPDSIDPYNYADLNPTTITDPTGLCGLVCAVEWVGNNLNKAKNWGTKQVENFIGGAKDATVAEAEGFWHEITYGPQALGHAMGCLFTRSCAAYDADQSRAFAEQRQLGAAIGGCVHEAARCAGAVAATVAIAYATHVVAGFFGSSTSAAAAADAENGAANAGSAPQLARQLAGAEASSIFTESGGLQREVIASSTERIAGTELGNPALVKRLTADGSDIADWGKYTTPSFASPSGPFQVHFYYNAVTDVVDYTYDFKVVFNAQNGANFGDYSGPGGRQRYF